MFLIVKTAKSSKVKLFLLKNQPTQSSTDLRTLMSTHFNRKKYIFKNPIDFESFFKCIEVLEQQQYLLNRNLE